MEQDRRRNNVCDRIKHIILEYEVVQKMLEAIRIKAELGIKEIELIKSDLSHLSDDVIGINRKGEKNEHVSDGI